MNKFLAIHTVTELSAGVCIESEHRRQVYPLHCSSMEGVGVSDGSSTRRGASSIESATEKKELSRMRFVDCSGYGVGSEQI